MSKVTSEYFCQQSGTIELNVCLIEFSQSPAYHPNLIFFLNHVVRSVTYEALTQLPCISSTNVVAHFIIVGCYFAYNGVTILNYCCVKLFYAVYICYL